MSPREVALATQVALYKAECGEETDSFAGPPNPKTYVGVSANSAHLIWGSLYNEDPAI